MNFENAPLEFSETQIKNIIEKYNLYQSELRNYDKRDIFIKSRQSHSEEIIEFRKKCFIIFCFSLYNVILAITSLTWFKELSVIEVILYSTLTLFIPGMYYAICQTIYEELTKNRNKRINEEHNNLIKLYEKKLYEKYEEYIEKYYKILDYNKKEKEVRTKQKEAEIISIIKRLSNMSKDEFRSTIKKILEYEGQSVSYIDIDNCLCRDEKHHKELILCKNIKRSISINDVKKFENQILESGYHYGIIYYTGDISTKAVNYCSRENWPIYLYNEFDISERIYKMDNDVEQENLIKIEQQD